MINVNELTANDIHLLKEYIKIIKKELSGSSNISYKTDQWLSTEGSSEGIAELWLDRFYNPQNVNLMNYDDLSSLPNLSPMDVVAVLKQQERGEISGTFQLKNSPGISYYGYKNLLDFITFENVNRNKVNVRYTSMVRSIPSASSLDEDEIPINFNNGTNPETLAKLLIGYGNINVGFLRHNHIGEAGNVYSDKTLRVEPNFSSILIAVFSPTPGKLDNTNNCCFCTSFDFFIFLRSGPLIDSFLELRDTSNFAVCDAFGVGIIGIL